MTVSSRGIATPDDGTIYNPPVDLAAMAVSIETNDIGKGSNAYTGTTAQRTAFTTARNGIIWVDTNGTKGVYRRDGSSWVRIDNGTTTTTMSFKAPYTAYSGIGLTVVSRSGNTVTISGTAGISGSTNISTSNQMFTALLPVWARPTDHSAYAIQQGSGSARWLLTVNVGGSVVGERYDPASTSTSLWLPFTITYVTSNPPA